MTASTKVSIFLLFMSSYPSQLSNKCKEIASKSNRDDYGNKNVKSNGFYEPKNSCTRASHFLVPFAPGYQREESLGTIYIKEHEIFKKNQMVHAIPFAKASEDVGCRSRRCTFFLLVLVSFITFGHTLKRLFYHKVIQDTRLILTGCFVPGERKPSRVL